MRGTLHGCSISASAALLCGPSQPLPFGHYGSVKGQDNPFCLAVGEQITEFRKIPRSEPRPRSGTIKINGKKAKVTTLNDSAWTARAGGVTLDISQDASGLQMLYTAKGGANGVCQVSASSGSAASSGAAPAGMPSEDEQACLAATSRETNNGDVTLLSSETSEANNTVYVGVGPQRAKWKCLVKNGKVAEVSSMGN